jgi:hypothetical protein
MIDGGWMFFDLVAIVGTAKGTKRLHDKTGFGPERKCIDRLVSQA